MQGLQVVFLLTVGASAAAPTLQPAVQAFFDMQNARNCSGWVSQFNDTFVVRYDVVADGCARCGICRLGLQRSSCIGSSAF
jgi:hypothetical protein